MVHQCVSEDLWFRNMLGIDVGAPPLPQQEIRLEFMKRYAEDSGKRLAALREKDESWWQEDTKFFNVQRSRAWVMTRRLTHTSHHRGQLMAMLRMLGRELHSNYGPTADTGGLMQNHAPTIYAYPSLDALLAGEAAGGRKAPLPGSGGKPVSERPAPQSR
jgi:DinB family